MRPAALVLSFLNATLALIALWGLLRLQRLAASRVLPVYLFVLVAERIPVWIWPEHFYRWSYWFATDLLEAALRLVLAAELLRLVFGHLPVSRTRAQWIAGAVLATTLVVILAAPAPVVGSVSDAFYEAARWASRASFASGALFAAVLALGLRYAVPLDPLHRDVAAGLALWTLLQAFPDELAALDAGLGLGRQGLQRLVYGGIMAIWARSAWQAENGQAQLGPSALRFLQPWRAAS